jgi:cell division protein ZipA
MDIDLRIILLIIGAIFIIGLIILDSFKRKSRENLPYKRFSEDENFELPSMSTSDDAPSHDALEELRSDEFDIIELPARNHEWQQHESDAPQVEPQPESYVEQQNELQAEATQEELTQVLSGAEDGVADEAVTEPTQQQPEQVAEPQMVLSLLVLAPIGEKFRGSQIKMALKEVGFVFGKMDIYHLMEGDDSLVSVANVLEPGTFDSEDMSSLKTPGLVIFSQLPAARSGSEMFEKWYRASRKVKAALGGRLTDLNQKPLDSDTFDRLRQQAEAIPATVIERSGE